MVLRIVMLIWLSSYTFVRSFLNMFVVFVQFIGFATNTNIF